MPTAGLALQPPDVSELSDAKMDALTEFRRSLRDTYPLHRLPLQAELVEQMMATCGRIVREYPKGCKCSGNITTKNGREANRKLCACCQRLFKAAEVLIELEKLSTRRQGQEANLINNFIRGLADMLANKKPDEVPMDDVADRVYGVIQAEEGGTES